MGYGAISWRWKNDKDEKYGLGRGGGRFLKKSSSVVGGGGVGEWVFCIRRGFFFSRRMAKNL